MYVKLLEPVDGNEAGSVVLRSIGYAEALIEKGREERAEDQTYRED